MVITFKTESGTKYSADLDQPVDLSWPLKDGGELRAWYIGPAEIRPVRNGDWVGEVASGGSVNFRNLFFNPHGHGTHTESVGHISPELVPVNECFTSFHGLCRVISVTPEASESDFVITPKALQKAWPVKGEEKALVIRTLPNSKEEKWKDYSHTNPPYFTEDAMSWIVKQGVQHLLTDLPSVDREEDGGKLLAHRAFWEYPGNPRTDKTITELIYVPDQANDGLYLLELQTCNIVNDAVPSRPVLFRIKPEQQS